MSTIDSFTAARANMQKATFLTTVRATGDEPSITISTRSTDRDGDVIEPQGGDLTNYKRNPVVLFGHDYSAIPVGSTTSIDVTADGLLAKWKWLQGDPFADRVKNAFDQGALRAASIGFRPLASEPLKGGQHYTQWELLEWSLVPVPANPGAIRALKGLGLWSPSVAKTGRALSAVNEAHLRNALDHADTCSEHLSQVLACLRDDDDVIDLDIEDDDDADVSVDRKTFEAAFGDARADLRKHVQQTVTRTIGGEFIDLDGIGTPTEIARLVRSELRRSVLNTLAPVITREIAATIAKIRGRLD